MVTAALPVTLEQPFQTARRPTTARGGKGGALQ